MDKHFQMNPLNPSNGLQLENQSSNQELGVLENIEQILMEEGNMDEQTHMLEESLDLQAKERSFYELLDGQKQPPSSVDDNYHNSTFSNSESEVVLNFQKGVDDANKKLLLSGSRIDEGGIKGSHLEEETSKKLPTVDPESTNVPIKESTDGVLKYIDQWLMEEGDLDEQNRMLQESLDFQAKERSFYELLVSPPPSADHNMTSVVDRFSYPRSASGVVFNFQKGVVEKGNFKGVRGKKNKSGDFGEEEERSKKLPATYSQSNNVPVEEFDNVLICTIGELEKKFEACTLQAKGRRRRNNEKELIDFRSLLISCAQSISADDARTAEELLKQIRKHSSPVGDGEQRFAHYFANGLEARLAGTGGQMRKPLLLVKRTTASDYLRAYYTYISSSPFVRISNFVSSKMIFDKPGKKNTVRIHIIDFGILYGFQWPTCFMHLSKQEGGPPKIKITGIDFPETGFRPAERVEETGRRLARYAKMFNVPFEFYAIAQNWESIKIEDLKLEKGEVVTVNCLYQAENLMDEVAGVGKSPRTIVLDLIKKIKPDYFIHGVVNASFASPFFVSRFREASFHYSALYDMLETTIPRGKPERTMLESDIFGKEALHVIACEDRERFGRTETYKQWRLRHLRAGFVQIPFGRDTMDIARNLVTNLYHRNFLIHEDNDWLLMGWKGRILFAISCWQPVSENASLR